MTFSEIFSILEVTLLAVVFAFLIRFVFLNYSLKVRKPLAWIHASKYGRISGDLLKAEKKFPDRIRFYNMWLQIERLKREGVMGDFAELGVYKGATARILHLCDPKRQLHLFDTFEGFSASDLKEETGKAASYTTQHFADTSLEKVKSVIGDHSNISYYKGYFPESASNCKAEKFSLVNIDVDLHKPTKAGLEFFYPRLSDGGIILIHDYNDDWPELMKTVNNFCKTIPENLVPVSDADGSVMIIKTNSKI